MFGNLLRFVGGQSFLSGFTLWVALGIAISSFGAGWTVRGWRADAKEAKAETKAVTQTLVRQQAGDAVIAKADVENRQIVYRYVTRWRTIDAASAAVKEEARDAENQAAVSGAPVVGLSPEWVRLYNAALRPGGGENQGAGGTVGPASGADQPAADAPTEWDVLSNHIENAKRWSECRAQLNALIDVEKGGQTGVVTP